MIKNLGKIKINNKTKLLYKLNLLLDKTDYIQLCILFFLMIMGSVMESLSVSMMLPFMKVVLGTEGTGDENGFVLARLMHFFEGHSLALLALILALLYLFKNLFLIFEYYAQYRFSCNKQFKLKEKFIAKLLRKPYADFLDMDTGEVIRGSTIDIDNTVNLIASLLSLLTELIVSAVLVGTILIQAPTITLVIMVSLIALLGIINRFIKPVLKAKSAERQVALSELNRWIIQSTGGIKEIKTSHSENYFMRHFNSAAKREAELKRDSSVIAVVPRFLIEAIFMSGMLIIIAFFIEGGSDIDTLMPSIVMIAVAAIRLMPAVSRISGALASIATYLPFLNKTVENILKEENLVEEECVIKTDIKRLERDLVLSNASFTYQGANKAIIRNGNLTIRKGESIGIIGYSGSGKTSLIDILLGLLKLQSGEVLIDGINIKDDYSGYLSQVGYIPQTVFLLNDTIRENIIFGRNVKSDSDKWLERAINDAALKEFIDSLPDGIDTQIGENGVRLSGGQRQRIGIARALYTNPEIVVFDEATSALDSENELSIMKSIYEMHGSKTIIIIAHRLSTIEKCNHVYRVENGEIIMER